jgi:hypothetical protein
VLGTREKWQAAARSEEDFHFGGVFAWWVVTKIFVEMRGARGLFKLLESKRER